MNRINRWAAETAVVFALACAARADATASWIQDADGNWSAGGNWTSGSAAAGTTGVATFSNAITASRTVTVDTSPWMIGGLVFGNTGAFGWTIAGGALNLDGTALAITVNPGSAAKVASVLSGSAGLTKAGAGTLTLSGANTYSGGTTLSDGALQIGDGSSATASAGRGALAVGGNTLILNLSGAATLADSSVTASGLIQNSGFGKVTLTNGVITGTVDGGSAGIVLANPISADFRPKGDVTFGSESAARTIWCVYPGTTLRIVKSGTFWWIGGVSAESATSFDIAAGVTVALSAGQGFGTLYYNHLTGPGGFTFDGDANQVGYILGASTLGGTLTANRPISFGNGGAGGTAGATMIDDTANGSVTFNSTTDATYSGNMSGAGALIKTNANTLTLSGTNTYKGATSISGGTLAIGGTGVLGAGSYSGNILNNGAFLYGSRAGQTLSGNISGTGSLIKASAGTLTLSGYNTYTGATRVNAGELVGATGGACVNSIVTIAAGATNGVSLLVPDDQWFCVGLTYAGGIAGLDFDLAHFPVSTTLAPLVINGDLNVAGTVGVVVRNGYWPTAGTYPLASYTGSLNGPGTFNLVSLPTGLKATLVNNTTAKRLDLSVTAVPKASAPMQTAEKLWTDVPYRVPDVPWDDQYGHHRAVLKVAAGADAVAVHVPWRRQDDPANKRLIVLGPEGKLVRNVLRRRVERESADLVFGPAPQPGVYHLYYLPFPVQPETGNYGHPYLSPEAAPEAEWTKRNGLDAVQRTPAEEALPRARVSVIEARTAFDSLYPMGVPLTAKEHAELLDKNSAPFLLFAEDRTRPIGMRTALPVCWREGEKTVFSGSPLRNEYYVFQVGVYAARQKLEKLSVRFSPLKGPKRSSLPAKALTCLNLAGVDPYGKPFTNSVSVAHGDVQALWIGVDLPRDVAPGDYLGQVTIAADHAEARTVELCLKVGSDLLKDRGDGDGWRLARLRWINSTLGVSDEPIPPYTPLKLKNQAISCLGRQVRLAESGLPAAIGTTRAPAGILAGPVRWVVETPSGPIVFANPRFEIVSRSAGRIAWRSAASAGGLRLECAATMEFDGYLHYRIALKTTEAIQVKDVRLEIPFRPETAEYMMGMGVDGGRMPKAHDWKWHGPQDSFWVGNPAGGLHCELRGSSYHGPMLNLYHPAPPASWSNGGQGGLRVSAAENAVVVTAYSGSRELDPATPVEFEFALLITPVKPLDPARQFTERYFHHIEPTDADVAAGIKVINVHHANLLNPFINYPFSANDRLKAFVDKWHARDIKVKIYYTLRELTNHLPEIWFLRSLGNEVYADGPGGGYPWLQEHLGSGYLPQWYFRFEDGTVCAAIANSGETRWYNFYVEGLGWLMKNIGIDGLYLDDVSYDRRTLQRMRRVMAASRPDCRIDLHSNTAFSIGPATQYAEFFPYVDKLWFGESFRYDQMTPDQWLVQASGIPFGLMGDMLQDGGNPWLGMVYGMTARLPWSSSGPKDPRLVWQVWDDFGIAGARMLGYWDAACPVRTGREDILATAYVKPGKALIAIGSWSKQDADVRLNIDWKVLGINPDRAILHAPLIRDFQEEMRWKPGDPIAVHPLRGWLIYVTEQ